MYVCMSVCVYGVSVCECECESRERQVSGRQQQEAGWQGGAPHQPRHRAPSCWKDDRPQEARRARLGKRGRWRGPAAGTAGKSPRGAGVGPARTVRRQVGAAQGCRLGAKFSVGEPSWKTWCQSYRKQEQTEML